MPTYRVIDLLATERDPLLHAVEAASPEQAGEKVVGKKLVRSGAPRNLRCRVYLDKPHQPSLMFRLYTRVT